MSKIETLPIFTGIPAEDDSILMNRSDNPSAGLWKNEQVKYSESLEYWSGNIPKIQIASADVLNLWTDDKPQVVLAGVGAGKFFIPQNCIISASYGGTPYATNTKLVLYYENSGVVLFETAGGLEFNVNTSYKMQPVWSNSAHQFVANDNLLLGVEVGNPTAGNSNLNVYIDGIIRKL